MAHFGFSLFLVCYLHIVTSLPLITKDVASIPFEQKEERDAASSDCHIKRWHGCKALKGTNTNPKASLDLLLRGVYDKIFLKLKEKNMGKKEITTKESTTETNSLKRSIIPEKGKFELYLELLYHNEKRR